MMKQNKLLLVGLGILLIIAGIMGWKVITKDNKKVLEANRTTGVGEYTQIKFEGPEGFQKKVQENELISFQEAVKGITNSSRFSHPNGSINGPYSTQEPHFTEVRVPDDFELSYYQQTYNAGMEWNMSSFVCSFELMVSKANMALFSFGYDGKAKYTQKIEMEYPIIGSSIAFEDCIVIMTQDDKGNVYMDVFDPLMKLLGHSLLEDIENIDRKSPVYIISRDATSFHILYMKHEQLYCSVYQFEGMKVTLTGLDKSSTDIKVEHIETFTFKESVETVVANNNIIGFEYKTISEEGDQINCLAIMNRQLELLDVFQLPVEMECSNLYVWQYDVDLQYGIAGDYKGKELIYLFEPKSSLEDMVYLNCLEYNEIFIDGKKVKSCQLLHNNYGGINHYKVDGDIILKTTNHESVISRYILEEKLAKKLNHIYLFKDNIFGFDKEELLFVDSYNKEGEVFEKLVGLRAFAGEFFQSYDGGLIYLDTQNQTIGKLHLNGTTEILAEMPKETYSAIIESGPYNYLSIIEYEKGIAVNTIREFIYYSENTKVWDKYPASDYSVRYDRAFGTYYYGDPIRYLFDPIEECFKLAYPFVRESYTTLEWNGHIYMNRDLYLEEDIEYFSTTPYFKVVESEYVTIAEVGGQKELHIIDSREVQGRKFVQLYDNQTIVEVKEDEIVPLVNIAVRTFDVNEKGILYTGYEDEAYAYFYSFETGKHSLLYDKEFCDELCLTSNKAIIITNIEELRLLDLEDYVIDSETIYLGESYRISQLVEESIPLPTGITYELSVVDDNVIISLHDHLLIAVIDPEKVTMVDKFRGRSIYLDETDLIYRVGNLLASYDFKEKTMDVLTYSLSPWVLAVKDGMIIYSAGWDEGHWYGTLPRREDFIGKTFKEEKDFYLFEFNNSGYLSELMLYDRKEKRITLLNGLVDLDYKLLPSSIQYEKSGPTYEDEAKWIDYPMPEGYTIGVLKDSMGE